MTGRQLVETAAWRANDLFHEVKVGNIHEVYDPKTPSTSPLWSHSFTPLGPCLTLTPPASASQYSPNISIKFRERAGDTNPCQWVEEGRSRQYSSSEDCPAAQHHCNTSCGWQHFLANFDLLLFHYLLSSSDSIWVTGMRNEMRLENAHIGSHVDVEPFTVIPLKEDVPMNSESCYYKCLMAHGERKANCTALMEDSLGEPLGSLCVTAHQQWSGSKIFLVTNRETDQCLHYCKSSNVASRWKCLLDTKIHIDKNVLRIRLAKPFTLILKETEMYPLSQFLTDTGGGLGLFLGVCALDGWNFLVHFIIIRVVTTRRPHASSLRYLAQIAGTVVASGVTCVHLLVMVKSFQQQPVNLAARQTLAVNEAYNSAPPVTSESLLMERMASRVLGCRVSSTARLDECTKCLLQGGQGQSLPFISVHDLPSCTPDHLSFPRLKFIVQKDYVEQIASREASCPACVHLNDSRPSDLVEYVIHEDSPGSSSRMVSAFGGLLGLYLGLTLLNVADLLKKSWVRQRLKTCGRCLIVAWLTFAGGVVATAVAISLLLLHTFLAAHPVYSSTSMHSLEEDILPSVTTCVWPPVNIQRLLEAAGMGAAFTDITHMKDPEERHAAITPLLQKLPQVSNITDPRVLWAAGAWNQREIYGTLVTKGGTESLRSRKYPITNTILNRCWKYTPTGSLSRSTENTKYYFHVQPRQDTVDVHNYFLVFLHYPDEVSLIEPKIFGKRITETVKIMAVTRWRAMEEKGAADRGDCVSRCLNDFLMEQLGCRLPWVVSLRDLPSCNLTQFTHFLSALWRLGTRPQNIYQNLVGRNQTRWCHTACSHRSQTFFMFRFSSTEDTVSSGLSVGLHSQKERFSVEFVFTTGVLERVSAHDGYPATQLVSDLGSVVGMTLGASLLSLLLTFVTKMSQSQKTLTKVSSLPSAQ